MQEILTETQPSKMKLSINLTDFQIMKALAITPANEEQTEAVMAAVHETPELDITEYLSSDPDYKNVIIGLAITAVAAISKDRNIE